MKRKFGNLTLGSGTSRATMWLTGLLAILLIALILISFTINTDTNRDKQYMGYAGELRVLSQEIAKNASEAAAGKQSAVAQPRRSRDDFERYWNYLTLGNEAEHLPPTENAKMGDVQALWNEVKTSADQILSSKDTVIELHAVADTLNEKVPQIQLEYEDVVNILLDNGAPSDQISVAQRQSLLAERILGSVSKVLEGSADAVTAADRFGRDTSLFGRVLGGMMEGNAAMGISRVTNQDARYGLEAIAEIFNFMSENVDAILEKSPELFRVREGANNIFVNSQTLLTETSELVDIFQNQAEGRLINSTLAYALLVVIFLLIVLVTFNLQKESKVRYEKEATQNEQNQNAILRLLDELADLADGDLTTEATVTEDFTGAIADSINFAIDQMRSLVTAINETAVRVAGAAQETQATAMHLADASEHQAQEIAGASAAINEMAVSIDQVSSNAAESAAVAERSVGIAKKGAEVVQNTIHGMDTIREQIQETAKRIKRLGESSQEIGDIVSLINDIADQTNILSLNAAIQASMAGDAGRGFAV